MAHPKRHETIETGVDQRQAERAVLDLPPAKLVCQSGEYLCAIRDISTLGVGLTFLHAAPPEPRVILQLASGATYPIERVWLGKRQAGYRFACDVAMEDFIGAGTRIDSAPLRLKLAHHALAEVRQGKSLIAVRLTELACESARIECETPLPLNCLLGFTLDGLPEQLGEVRWQDGAHFGLTFQHRLTLEELAQCAMQLQPFDTPLTSGGASTLRATRAA